MEKGLLIDLIFRIISDFLACAEIFLFLTKLLLLKIDRRIYRWIIASAWIIISDVLISMRPELEKIVIFQLMGFLFAIVFCITGNKVNSLIRSIFAMVSMYGLRKIVNIIYLLIYWLGLKKINIEIDTIERTATLVGEMLIVAIILCIGNIVKKTNGYSRWITSINNSIYIIMALCIFMMALINGYIEYKNVGNNHGGIWIIVQLLFSVSVHLFCLCLARIDYNRQCYERESILKEQYLVASREYFEKLKWQIDEIRRMKHDMNAHYLALDLFLQNNDIDGAKEYLSVIREHQISAYNNYFTVGNELVDAVISGIVSQHEGVTIHVDGFVGKTEIQDYDLCTIFSNLVQNASEAVDVLETNKEINIEIRRYQQRLLISVSNHFKNHIDINNLGKYTTKIDSDNHGYGISNIRKTVEKYHGEIRFEINDDVFFANLFINEYSK